MIAIWDDHEFSDDCWQDRQVYAATDDATANTRRRRANQAWFEFMPADVSFNRDNPAFDNIQIYRSFRFGTLATLLMTDLRLYRADHIIPEKQVGSEIGSRYFVPKRILSQVEAAKISAASGRLTPVSMLGDTQRLVENQLRASATTWNLWGNEVSLLRMQFNGAQAVAGLLAQGLAAANNALTPLVPAMANALVQDLTGADHSSGKPVTAYPALSALLAAQAGIPAGAFAAQIKPLLDAQLPPSAPAGRIPAQRRSMGRLQRRTQAPDGLRARYRHPQPGGADRRHPRLLRRPGHGRLRRGHAQTHHGRPGHGRHIQQLVLQLFQERGGQRSRLRAGQAADLQRENGALTNTFNATLKQFNGGWLRHVDTDAQGFAVVTLTPAELRCVFSKLKPLNGKQAPALPAVASRTTLTVAAGTPEVNVGV